MEAAAPIQNLFVGGYEQVVVQCGRDNDPVGRITVEGGQSGDVDADFAIDGSFLKALMEQAGTPSFRSRPRIPIFPSRAAWRLPKT